MSWLQQATMMFSARSGFSEILRYIDRNLEKKLTIQTLAEQFGYNPTYLARKFALEFGTPPAKYVLRQRIVRCHHLLLATNLSLEQIAAETGFYDASHFIAKFKQFEGVTPLMYRKQNRGRDKSGIRLSGQQRHRGKQQKAAGGQPHGKGHKRPKAEFVRRFGKQQIGADTNDVNDADQRCKL